MKKYKIYQYGAKDFRIFKEAAGEKSVLIYKSESKLDALEIFHLLVNGEKI